MTAPFAFLLIAQQAAPSGGLGGSAILFQFAAIFVLFYFLFVRPQQKQRKQHEERLRHIKRGDIIVTMGGVVGEIVHINQGVKDGAPTSTPEDHITIKSGESRLIIERGRIARVNSSEPVEDEKAK